MQNTETVTTVSVTPAAAASLKLLRAINDLKYHYESVREAFPDLLDDGRSAADLLGDLPSNATNMLLNAEDDATPEHTLPDGEPDANDSREPETQAVLEAAPRRPAPMADLAARILTLTRDRISNIERELKSSGSDLSIVLDAMKKWPTLDVEAQAPADAPHEAPPPSEQAAGQLCPLAARLLALVRELDTLDYSLHAILDDVQEKFPGHFEDDGALLKTEWLIGFFGQLALRIDLLERKEARHG